VHAPARIAFDAPPGTMQLRVSVEGAASQVLDSETREVAVPDLTSPQTMLGTPALYRARTIRDLQQIKTDPNAVPSTVREFNRTDRVLVRVPAYAAGTSTAAVTARVLNRAGDPMNELPAVPPASPGGDAQFDVPLAPLPPGEYIIEIKAAGGAADKADQKQLVGFRITG
jgi:hypothetical protein